MEEIWKDIKFYENMYQVSNKGNVRSLDRMIKRAKQMGGGMQLRKGKKMSHYRDPGGYRRLQLCKNGKQQYYFIHQLVWDAFGDKPRNGRKIVPDHINDDKEDNRIDNLQLLTHRGNISKGKLKLRLNGLPTGVTRNWNKFEANIQINKKKEYLGLFNTVREAEETYQNKLLKINDEVK